MSIKLPKKRRMNFFGTLALIFGALSAGLGLLRFYRIQTPKAGVLAVPKLLTGAFSPYLAVMGWIGVVLGLLGRAPLAFAAGLFGLWSHAQYVWKVMTSFGDFAAVFGPDWKERIPPERFTHMLAGRWTWQPPAPPEPRCERNIPFYAVPGTGRTLLCDIWQPPLGITPSKLALIYFHGSGWHFLDKDMGTRPFFNHLAAQGHVIMDVAYRLCPETNWHGMLEDVKHAIAWMKVNGGRYGVDPGKIVLSGGSAGGHLALLAAFTVGNVELTPADLGGVDLTVRGVISLYGPTDMMVYYQHAGKIFDSVVPPEQAEETPTERFQNWLMDKLGFRVPKMTHWKPGVTVQENMMRALFGGTPDEVPDEYLASSPVYYARPGCPPTLLLQGEHDSIVSAEAVQSLAEKLRQAGVATVHVEYPQTEHAFDLILPILSPPAQASWYEVERFLALLV